MRFLKLAALPLLAVLALMPARGNAQVSATVHIGPTPRAWGHEVVIGQYNTAAHGDWHTADRRWSPVTLYFHDGRYFDRRVSNSRPVMVYRWHNQYFFPPHEAGWMHHDRRFNYKYAPLDEDYNRPRPGPDHP